MPDTPPRPRDTRKGMDPSAPRTWTTAPRGPTPTWSVTSDRRKAAEAPPPKAEGGTGGKDKPLKSYHKGGKVTGKGREVTAKLQPGEHVVTSAAAKRHPGLLRKLHGGAGAIRYRST